MERTPIGTDSRVIYKNEPMNHQVLCLTRHGQDRAFFLAGEQGTGKTFIIINNAAQLWHAGQCDAVLVLAPNGVHINWTKKEIPKHLPDWVQVATAAHSIDNRKAQRDAVSALLVGGRALRILTMNCESIGTKNGFAIAEAFARSASKLMLVVDESDTFKNPSAIRTKALMRLKPLSMWRRTMTGTPSDGSPYALYSQYNFLDERILDCPNYWAYKAEYGVMLHRGHPLLEAIKRKNPALRGTPQIEVRDANGRPKYRNLEKLAARIAPHTFRVLKKDCLDLPPKVYKTVYFPLTPEQQAIYTRAENDLRVDDTPFHRIAISTKLAQITSGYYVHPASPDPVRIPGATPRMDLLIERIQSALEANEQVIVWARYTPQILHIAEALTALKIPHATYYGETKQDARTEAREAFERGDIKVFVGNQQAGGAGIELVAASVVIYFSNNFTLRDRLQSEDRAHRKGQTHTVVYIDMIAENTIDEDTVEALVSKQDVAEAILTSVQRRRSA